ncbi:MAG TPA: hypothetical protein VG204_09225 [Terriglobia bacterium]|nr:hypothetical protein [Terriglobia bacterium]
MPRIQRPARVRGRDYYLDPPAYQKDTAVEELDHQHPGLQKFVEEQLAAATPMRKIEALVKERFSVGCPSGAASRSMKKGLRHCCS